MQFQMDYGSQAKKIELEEIIEHYVTESRRVSGGEGPRRPLKEIVTETVERRYNEELPYHDFQRTSQNSLQATSSAFDNDAERRSVCLYANFCKNRLTQQPG